MRFYRKDSIISSDISILLRFIVHSQRKESILMQIITNQYQKELKDHGNYHFSFLISDESLSKYESGSFLWHWHPEIELTLLLQGQMIYKVNNNTFHLKKGEALFGNTSALHTGYMYQNQDCNYISITFDPKLIYGYENSIVYINYVKPILQNFSFTAMHFDLSESWHFDVLTILNEMIQINTTRYVTYEMDIIIKLNQFWQLLFLHNEFLQTITPYDKRNYDRIRSVLSYISENYSSKLTLEDIANHIYICKSECCRIFKRYMKVSLFEFIIEYRIEKSVDYLLGTKYSITEIAEIIGFNDSNHFSKVFHKLKGNSPTQYRKLMVNQTLKTSDPKM